MVGKFQVRSGKRARKIAVAGLAALGAAELAQAAPIVTNNVNLTLSNPGTLQLDLDDNKVPEGNFVLNNLGCGTREPGCSNPDAELLFNPLTNPGTGKITWVQATDDIANPLGAGEFIGPAANFVTNNVLLMSRREGDVSGAWVPPVDPDMPMTGFVGLWWDIPGGSPHFGWARITVDGGQFSLTLHDYAYEGEAGTGIPAGAGLVPEPATLGMLALGAAGLAAWRKKRAA
jgi:hypothetical protein